MESIILFIFIAAASTLFSKMKENPAPQKRRSLPELKREFQETFKEISKTEIPRNKKEMEQRIKQTQIPQAVSVSATPRAKASRAIPEPHHTKIEPIQEREVKEQKLDVTEKNLAEAIVWAEILGPPRSKRPYHKR